MHREDVGGLIYLCLADEAPDIAAFAESARRYLAPHGLHEAKIAHESTIVERGNWKLVVENNRECHHCSGSHPSPCRTFSDRPSITAVDVAGGVEPDIDAHWTRCEAAGAPRCPAGSARCRSTTRDRSSPSTTRRPGIIILACCSQPLGKVEIAV